MTASRLSKFALAALVAILIASLCAAPPRIALGDAFYPISARYFLGATPLGQSVLLQIVAGASQTLSIALAALLLAIAFSLAMAALVFLLPKPFQDAYAFLVDAWLAIPGIFIALSIGFFLPQSWLSVLCALVLSETAALQKFILQRLRQAGQSDYIVAATVMGSASPHIVSAHLLPRLARDATYLFFLTLPSIVLSLASLEFLGVQTGAERLSLGMQIALYKDYILLYPNLSLAPVFCLLLLLFLLHEVSKLVKNRE